MSRPVLRPYQERNAAELLALIQRRVKGAIYVLPTGGGKTRVAANIARRCREAGLKVAFFAHRKELLRQISEALADEGVDHGIIRPGHQFDGQAAQVASIDTVLARFSELANWLASIDVAIFDEAHHVVAAGWARIASTIRGTKIGITATPYRLDGKALGEDGQFTVAVRGPEITDLIRDGWLVPYAVYAPDIGLDLTGIRKRLGDYVVADLDKAMNRDEVSTAAIRAYARLCPGSKAVVFCVSVAHAQAMAAAFTAAGWAAASVDGSMSETDRDAVIGGLASGRYQVISSCNLISEGWDVPGLEAAILARPTKSTALYLQQVGRISRPAPGKREGIVIDLAKAVAEHGMPDEMRRWSLKGGLKGEERIVIGTRRCRACHHVCAKGPSICPKCRTAYPTPMPTKQPALSGMRLPIGDALANLSLDQIRNMQFRNLVELARTRADFERIAKAKGYQPGWAYHAMKQKAGQTSTRRYG